MSSFECPDEEVLAAFAEGGLLRDELVALEEHLDGCGRCRATIGALLSPRARPSSPPSWLEPGARLGRFTLGARLGEGGMGIVFRAFDTELERHVALKLLRAPEVGATSEEIESLVRREARAMARLSHPNVVQLYEVATSTEGEVFLGMELVEGTSLREHLRSPRPRSEIIRLLLEAGRGLFAAHSAGLVHRDFKPENVLVGDDGRARVTDFGLAKALAARTITGEHAFGGGQLVAGTPGYLAPEVRWGEPATILSDQYSFATVATEALAGHRVPRRLRAALRRALSDEPTQRFGSLEPLLSALHAALQEGRRRAWAAVSASAALSVAGLLGLAWIEPRWRCQRGGERLVESWRDLWAPDLSARLSSRPETVRGMHERMSLYAGRWRDAFLETCGATWIRGAQSPALLDLRMRCLVRRHEEAEALVRAIGELDGASLAERAPISLAGLSSPESCLMLDLQPNQRATHAADAPREVTQRRRALIDGKALLLAGRLAEAEAGLRALVEGSGAEGALPHRAEALSQLSWLRWRQGRLDESAGLAFDALLAAQREGDDGLVAGSLVQLVRLVGVELSRTDEGAALARVARATLERLRLPRTAEPWISHLVAEAQLQSMRGRVRGARERLRDAEARSRAAPRGPDFLLLAGVLAELADVSHRLGRTDDARSALERARSLTERWLGAGHPESAATLERLAVLEADVGHHVRASELFRQALDLRARGHAGELWRVPAILGQGVVLRRRGHLDEAHALLTQAVTIVEERLGPASPRLVEPLVQLGACLWKLGRWERAREVLARGLLLAERAPDPSAVLEPLFGLAQLSRRAGASAKARELLERALEAGARSERSALALAPLQFELAQLLADEGGPSARAELLARQALGAYTSAGPGHASRRAEVTAFVEAMRRPPPR